MTSAPASVDIGTLLWKSPHKGGRACIAGTNITVSRVVNLTRQGMTPEQIVVDGVGADVVSLAHVYAALSYYFANSEEIDGEIAELERSYDEGRKDPRVRRPPR